MISTLLVAMLAAAPAVPTDPLSLAVYEQLKRGLPTARVGQWVTYELKGGPQRNAFWRLAVVGREKDEYLRNASWLEVDIGEHANMVAPLLQLRMLIADRQGSTSAGLVTRLFVSAGLTQPQEVERDAVVQAFANGPKTLTSNGFTAADLSSRPGKAARLMTAAGSVTAVPTEILYRQTVLQRFWLSTEVPLLHIARLEIPPIDHALELRDYGTNAKPMMRAPRPDAPKIRLERTEAAPVLDSKPGDADAHP